MNTKIDFHIMTLCDRTSYLMGYEDIKYKKFNIDGLCFIIVGIDFYHFGGLPYCYQLQTIQFDYDGKEKEGLFLNNLFQDDFFSMVQSFRYYLSKGIVYEG